jgi:hypothetical protein
MSLNHRQRHRLHRMEDRLLRSAPQLASMLGDFGTVASPSPQSYASLAS